MKYLLIASLAVLAAGGPLPCGGDDGLSVDEAYAVKCSELEDDETANDVARALVKEIEGGGNQAELTETIKQHLFAFCDAGSTRPGRDALQHVGTEHQ